MLNQRTTTILDVGRIIHKKDKALLGEICHKIIYICTYTYKVQYNQLASCPAGLGQKNGNCNVI